VQNSEFEFDREKIAAAHVIAAHNDYVYEAQAVVFESYPEYT
jgi:hypothetical protein